MDSTMSDAMDRAANEGIPLDPDEVSDPVTKA
jgi:hypothetical protein